MRNEIDIAIIENVKALRKRENLKLRELAEIIGTSHNFIAQVENPNSQCKYSASHLYKMAKYIESCSILDLFPPIKSLEP